MQIHNKIIQKERNFLVKEERAQNSRVNYNLNLPMYIKYDDDDDDSLIMTFGSMHIRP